MRNEAAWRPTKYVQRAGRWRSSIPKPHIDCTCDLAQPLRVAEVWARHFPLGYFVIAHKPLSLYAGPVTA
jgi:hypothetical protein